jgi:hypothetical protein
MTGDSLLAGARAAFGANLVESANDHDQVVVMYEPADTASAYQRDALRVTLALENDGWHPLHHDTVCSHPAVTNLEDLRMHMLEAFAD